MRKKIVKGKFSAKNKKLPGKAGKRQGKEKPCLKGIERFNAERILC